jgi:hypothetical protein
VNFVWNFFPIVRFSHFFFLKSKNLLFSRLNLIQLIIFYTLFSFLVPGCNHVALVGNGFCNDETNNPDCNHDGGDCCPNSNMVGNGVCNDETNNPECNYDGGDCCGPAVSCKYFKAFLNHLPTYVRTFQLHKVRENCHFLEHPPTPMSLRNIKNCVF